MCLSGIFRQKKRIQETGDRIQGPRPSATGGAALIGVAGGGANVVLKPLRGNRSNRWLPPSADARHDRGMLLSDPQVAGLEIATSLRSSQ